MQPENPRSTKPIAPAREIPREIAEGFRYAMQHTGIRRMLVILSMVSVFGRPYMELLFGFVDGVFGRGAEGYAFMVSMTGTGAVISGFWLALRGRVTG